PHSSSVLSVSSFRVLTWIMLGVVSRPREAEAESRICTRKEVRPLRARQSSRLYSSNLSLSASSWVDSQRLRQTIASRPVAPGVPHVCPRYPAMSLSEFEQVGK